MMDTVPSRESCKRAWRGSAPQPAQHEHKPKVQLGSITKTASSVKKVKQTTPCTDTTFYKRSITFY